MLAHVVTGALGVTALEGLDNTLVLYDRLPQCVAPDQRQTLGFKEDARETPVHVGEQSITGKADDKTVEIEIGLRVDASRTRLACRQPQAFEIVVKLGQFLFAMVHSGELHRLTLGD